MPSDVDEASESVSAQCRPHPQKEQLQAKKMTTRFRGTKSLDSTLALRPNKRQPKPSPKDVATAPAAGKPAAASAPVAKPPGPAVAAAIKAAVAAAAASPAQQAISTIPEQARGSDPSAVSSSEKDPVGEKGKNSEGSKAEQPVLSHTKPQAKESVTTGPAAPSASSDLLHGHAPTPALPKLAEPSAPLVTPAAVSPSVSSAPTPLQPVQPVPVATVAPAAQDTPSPIVPKAPLGVVEMLPSPTVPAKAEHHSTPAVFPSSSADNDSTAVLQSSSATAPPTLVKTGAEVSVKDRASPVRAEAKLASNIKRQPEKQHKADDKPSAGKDGESKSQKIEDAVPSKTEAVHKTEPPDHSDRDPTTQLQENQATPAGIKKTDKEPKDETKDKETEETSPQDNRSADSQPDGAGTILHAEAKVNTKQKAHKQEEEELDEAVKAALLQEMGKGKDGKHQVENKQQSSGDESGDSSGSGRMRTRGEKRTKTHASLNEKALALSPQPGTQESFETGPPQKKLKSSAPSSEESAQPKEQRSAPPPSTPPNEVAQEDTPASAVDAAAGAAAAATTGATVAAAGGSKRERKPKRVWSPQDAPQLGSPAPKRPKQPVIMPSLEEEEGEDDSSVAPEAKQEVDQVQLVANEESKQQNETKLQYNLENVLSMVQEMQGRLLGQAELRVLDTARELGNISHLKSIKMALEQQRDILMNLCAKS